MKTQTFCNLVIKQRTRIFKNSGPKTTTSQNIGAASAAPAAPLLTPMKITNKKYQLTIIIPLLSVKKVGQWSKTGTVPTLVALTLGLASKEKCKYIN